MTEAVVSGKDVRCLFINNGDDLLTLKKVVSKKSDKDDGGEKQKNKKSDELNGSELNGNHNKTDSINFDIDNTSSLEPNLEMDSDTDRNITIDSICTQEDRESENIDVSNENSTEADVKHCEKDIKAVSTKCSSTPDDSLDDNEYSPEFEDEDLESNNIRSPASYFNISSRAPLHDLDTTLEDNIFSLEEETLILDRKRKYNDLSDHDEKSSKILKLWNIMKYPFQKLTTDTSINKNVIIEEDNEIVPGLDISVNSDKLETEEAMTSNNTDTKEEIENTSENTTNKQKFCNIM